MHVFIIIFVNTEWQVMLPKTTDTKLSVTQEKKKTIPW